MRTPIIAGNWKMYNTIAEARHLVSEMVPGLQAIKSVEKVLCPPFTSLLAVRSLLEGTEIGLGGQDVYWETSGAFTGEVSPTMLAELCQYVIIGHSERRAYFGESDVSVNRKVHASLAHRLKPIVCVGETLDENEAGKTTEVVTRQVKVGLQGLDSSTIGLGDGNISIIIAYEPVWAIGTGRAATAEDANGVVANVIRPILKEMFNETIAQAIRVLYGGSVKASNAGEFFQQPEIDGALVGGASLKASEFVSIVQAASR